jgi:hypothetical protein
VSFFDGEPRTGDIIHPDPIAKYNMMMETYAAETLLGKMKDTDDKQGMGISQIDRIKYDDIIMHSQEHREAIWNKWHIDINLVTFEALRYAWKPAVIFTRLGYKRIIERIPHTRIERADYWVRNWNVCGAGKIEEYMERCEVHLGPEVL